MPHRSGPEGHSVLICAPYGRDADNVARLLRDRGFDGVVCGNIAEVARRVDDHAGLVLVTEEALRADLQPLRRVIEDQPTWSDLPFVLLVSKNVHRPGTADAARIAVSSLASNIVVLERPLGSVSLVSAVDSALRGRRRQFDLRDRLAELAASQASLMTSEAALRRAAERLEVQVAQRTRELEAEVENRSQAEAALRQSQKMEAVGQLTGGIAHDFNNMLTGIIGAHDMIRRRRAAGRDEDTDRYMDVASASAQRAAALTERLLAFSRRQSLDARPLDANALVTSLLDLLRRTVGERISVEVALDADSLLIADGNQLESAILNLSINARDAMPDGGRLRIETSVVDAALIPGRTEGGAEAFVRIAVLDTGVGMSREVLDKVFEPFFTTKPIGQGTGLGLSMVYGFAKQSGGLARVFSTPGAGTAVEIFLPTAELQQVIAPIEDRAEAPRGDGKHVLLVEDDPSVRLLVRDVLVELGYDPVEVAEPHAAIACLRSASPLDLMISDVGLPGMNGRQLAEVAREHRPDLPILFVTGYAENAAIRSSFLGTNMDMITKPFDLETLGRKIAEMTGAAKAERP